MIRYATDKDRNKINKVVTHPLQSWEWGEFRRSTGVKVSRFLEIEDKKIINSFQITWHKIPLLNKYIGYCPKSVVPNEKVVEFIKKEANKKGAVMVKFEPNESNFLKNAIFKTKEFVAGKPLFTKFSFVLSLDNSEEELLKNLQQKTRYNLRLAEKRGVEIVEDNSDDAFEEYWRLTEETTKRQKFYSHSRSYHQKMFKQMTGSGIGHMFLAKFNGKVLTAWMIFVLNKTGYYPYGASSTEHREVMANNLMMWKVLLFAKSQGCVSFDMWGSMGPNPDTKDPWYGFHKFKEGYGGVLTENLGTYDLIVNNFWYETYLKAEKIRWTILRLNKKLFS